MIDSSYKTLDAPVLRRGIPASTGTSYKPQHFDDIAERPGTVSWFEIHPENYMVAGGQRLAQLEALRSRFPLSFHGVGLSLGSGELPDSGHLKKFKALIDRFEPGLVSEHLAWSSHDGIYLADLLPPALTQSVLNGVIDALDKTQNLLGRQLLIENPSWYLPRPDDWMAELQFLDELVQRSGCALLVDVNNIYVSAHNLRFDANAYIDSIPVDAVAEVHLAGHSVDHFEGDTILIDTHGAPIDAAVWALYARLVQRTGLMPTLVEWDNDVPDWQVLHGEAHKTQELMSATMLSARTVS